MDNSFAILTAFPGGGQARATPIAATFNRVTVVATAADSAVLPNAAPGLEYTVKNAAAANAMSVFANPTSSPPMYGILDTIPPNANGVAYSLAAGKSAKFFCIQLGIWDVLLSA